VLKREGRKNKKLRKGKLYKYQVWKRRRGTGGGGGKVTVSNIGKAGLERGN